MKILSSFAVLSVSGSDRISYTFDEVDEKTGEATSKNNRDNFYALDPELEDHINAIRKYIRDRKLS